MKTIKYFLILGILFNIVSCKVEDADSVHNKRTTAAKLIYDDTIMSLEGYLETFNILQNVDLYIQAADAAKRRNIGNTLLTDFEVGLDADGVCTLIKRSKVWTIASGNQPLDTPGTIWRVSYKYHYYMDEAPIPSDEQLVVECVSLQKWNFTVQENKNWFVCNAAVMIEQLEKRPQQEIINSDYAISGSGGQKSEDREVFLDIDFIITSPLIYKPVEPVTKTSPPPPPELLLARFVEGGINMTVVGTGHPAPEKIKAVLTNSNGDDVHIGITFRDLTEVWEVGKYR